MFQGCARLLTVLAALFASLALIAPQAASASPAPKKQFTVTLSPNPVSGGSAVTETVTFADLATSNQSIGSVQLTIPSGFTNVSLAGANANSAGATATQNSDGSWTVTCGTAAGSCAFANGNSTASSIAAGSSGSIQISMTTPSSCTSSSYTLNAFAHQANNFNSGGNILNPNPTAVSLTVNSSCSFSKLAFATGHEPADANMPVGASTSNVITATDWTPPATGVPPVEVQLEDASGNAVAVSGVPVTMSVGNDASSLQDVVLGGTKTVDTDANGVATFSDLTLDELGSGYTLKASSSGATTTSTAFDIANNGSDCTENLTCQVTTGNNISSFQFVTNGNNSKLDAGTLDVNLNNGQQLVCPNFNDPFPNTFNVGMTGNVINRGGTITETIFDVASSQSAAANIKAGVQICFGDTKQFINSKNKPAAAGTLPDGTTGFVDLLPNCPQRNNPCIDRSAGGSQPDPNGAGFDITVVAQIPPGFDFAYRQ